ncbi:MAG TPA: hypothetical protein VIU63_03770 [Nitrospira sp.]
MVTIQKTSVGAKTVWGGLMAGVLLMVMVGCSSEQPKPMAQPTPDQVRGHADKSFDKLKQEERERAAQPPAPY